MTEHTHVHIHNGTNNVFSYWWSCSFDRDIWLPLSVGTGLQRLVFWTWQRLDHLLWQSQQSQNIPPTMVKVLSRLKESEMTPHLHERISAMYLKWRYYKVREHIFVCFNGWRDIWIRIWIYVPSSCSIVFRFPGHSGTLTTFSMDGRDHASFLQLMMNHLFISNLCNQYKDVHSCNFHHCWAPMYFTLVLSDFNSFFRKVV